MIRSKALTRGRCGYSSTRSLKYFVKNGVYEDRYSQTIQNLKIGSHTRVIFQGFTGKQATANAKESIEWGTNIVGGVTPGKNGEHLGLPVLPTVKEAMEQLKPDATGIYVAAHQAPAAIEEAIEAEVPLIVAVAEHIPLHDMLRIHNILDTQSKSRLVGANTPGIISAIGKCRIGFQPLPCFTPGRIGIVAKSGTLSYEAVASTTRAGLGQSLCIGMGGDILAGTDFVDALKIFEHDDDTEGIIIIGEIGGEAELKAAAWIEEYRKRSLNPKPIAALVVGNHAVPGKVMGHAGAFTLPGEPDVLTKIKAFENVGVTMVNHPAKFGNAMKTLLGDSGRSSNGLATSSVSQKRNMHTMRIRSTSRTSTINMVQKRTIYLKEEDAFKLLDQKGISRRQDPSKKDPSKKDPVHHHLTIGIDRSNRCPQFILQELVKKNEIPSKPIKIPFQYDLGITIGLRQKCATHLQLVSQHKLLHPIIAGLFELFKGKEAFLLETTIRRGSPWRTKSQRRLSIEHANFGFDDAAFKSANRHSEIHSLPQADIQDPAETEAQKHGIVYIKLAGDGNIGTLVNGAGLAMNTVDALADAGGKAANFLDTGGKATAETVKKSFKVILGDERVKVVFVNIFGGLTLGDMIAEGILLAFRELGVEVPVVVRIRGTNEKEGQRIIAESGLPLYAYDDFDEAAAKVIELANSSDS
ncbi:6ecee962-6519-40d3-86b2-bf828ae16a88 [Sclerotinia trifoliorum]|uniref:6ecee962-6519-40d3-86b2-bf828ae16a88 n=1 Tax=Sclerotinia trifoliorum TaxID=28548 RepID=A0A8H2VYL6_9HELO|nr:6ecee962-6519-40d3-86b2-bf828ae16a88 [Sclerotinia trifoliorum]